MDIARSYDVHHTTIGRLAASSSFEHGAGLSEASALISTPLVWGSKAASGAIEDCRAPSEISAAYVKYLTQGKSI
jgi:hypothetical protein